MTKVASGARPVFDVHTTDVVKGVQHDSQISTDVISKAKIEKAGNPSLASKTVITKAKSENNTQILWKVAGVVMLAVSSIFLWHYLQAPPAVQNSANIMATRNPFADPSCMKTGKSFGNMCIDHNAVQSIYNAPVPLYFPGIEASLDDNGNAMSFDENDIMRLGVLYEWVACIFEGEAQDAHALKNVWKLHGNEHIFLGLKLAEKLITEGKYDEAYLATHGFRRNMPWTDDRGELKRTVKALGQIVQNSKTPSIQIEAMRRLYSLEIKRVNLDKMLDCHSCLKIAEDLFKRGYLSESIEALRLGGSLYDPKTENNLLAKIAIASMDNKVRLRALDQRNQIENPFPLCIKIAENLLQQGKISEAFKVLDVAFNNSDMFSWWFPGNTLAEESRKVLYGEYSPELYDLDRIKATDELYASLDKVIKELVAKKEMTFAQSIVDRLMISPVNQFEGNYCLWDQEKMNTLIGHVKQASV